MLITIDLEHPDNDVEIVGLAEGEAIETRLGPKGYAAYRVFGAAARLLFLSLQKLDKPDVAAATDMMIERESDFIRQRLGDLRAGAKPQLGQRETRGGQRSDRPDRPQRSDGPNRSDRNRGRR